MPVRLRVATRGRTGLRGVSDQLLPDAIRGWVIDHVLVATDHTVIVAARRSAIVGPRATAVYASIVLVRPGHETAASRELARLGTDPSTPIEAVWGAHRVPARVLASDVGLAAGVPAPASCATPAPGDDAPRPGTPMPPPARERRPPVAKRRCVVIGGLLSVSLLLLVSLAHLRASDAAGAAPFTWDATTATATRVVDDTTVTFILGEPGDQVVLGDWDADGLRTPALYRPTAGEVWIFDAWAGAGTPTTAHLVSRVTTAGTLRAIAHDGHDIAVVVAALS